jgi:two-component SAPR family response regulator
MAVSDRKLKVLIVEDEAIVALHLEDTLTELGYEVVATAGRVDTATKLASTLPLDLAIVDLNLNGERTDGVADVLASRGVAIVFATGYGAAALEKRWAQVPTLQKPFQSIELERAIVRAVQRPPA